MSINSGGDGWLQDYEEQQQMATCSDAVNLTSSLSPSCGGSTAAPAPASAAGRRSRSSRRAIPTTLLNANPSNFRALVQRFTGRSSGANSVRRRGPVTLDFGSSIPSAKKEIFPSGGSAAYEGNYDYALHQRGDDHGQCHRTWPQWEGEDAGREKHYYQETASYEIGQENSIALHGGFDDHHDGLSAEHVGNSNYAMDRMDYGDYHHDSQEMVTMEEFMMTDLDTLLSNRENTQ